MLIDGQVLNGLTQEGLLVRYRHSLTIEMQAQHCLLDEILGIFVRAALTAQEFQQAFEMCGARYHVLYNPPFSEALRNCVNDPRRESGDFLLSRQSLRVKQGCREGHSPQFELACPEFPEPLR
jgi:hypothetical protein